MALTDLSVERIRPLKDREKFQADMDGLYLKITPKKKKSWYHYGKTRKWLKIGDYPALSLSEARSENKKYKRATDKGLNHLDFDLPKQTPTVREFYDRWFKEGADKNSNPWSVLYKRNVYYIFETDVLPYIGGAKVKDITKQNVAHILQKVLDRKANSHTRQVYLRLKRFFNYAAELDLIKVSPMVSMPTKGTANTKDRVLKAEEIKTLLAALPGTDMAENTSKVLELILRTGQRPGECAGIHKDEVEENWWTIPGERTKNGLAHRVYLTDEALRLIGDPGTQGYYLDSPFTGKPLHRNAVSKALRRSLTGEEKTQKDKTPSLSMDFFTPHDLRRTCATHLADLGFTDDVIGAVLNHKKRSVTGIYNRHQYDNEKQNALETWNRKIQTLIDPQHSSSKVINLR